MRDLAIDELIVAHRLKNAAGQGMPESELAFLHEQGFLLDTCLRQLSIFNSSDFGQDIRLKHHLADSEIQWLYGKSAYSFLLETATGLNSQIPGETNILGQFRRAWQEYQQRAEQKQVRSIESLISHLFSDSRIIRRDYLQGIGGNSYGSLVRKLIKPESESRILFVGAGKLAQSMLSFFSGYEFAIWNHRPPQWTPAGNYTLFNADTKDLAAQWATDMVLTIPADERHDRSWLELASQETTNVVHMGRRRADPGVWSEWKNASQANSFYDLDDVFALRNKQSTVRSLQLRRARLACQKLAAERQRFTMASPQLKAMA